MAVKCFKMQRISHEEHTNIYFSDL